ncbi:immunoglobulin superfamily member 5 [Electrophorus electricus]|uniref:immunoglobulin superfamily member 5 n=1 Tax=Electrophorus electricus TaxID=8005 RepID=UPI0015D0AFAE|nr:immunoglobulin superfamily member 5 [Electrophorus electricus]
MVQWLDCFRGNKHGILRIAVLAHLIQVVVSTMAMEPRNVTALCGTSVCFNCSSNEDWDAKVWQLNRRSLLAVCVEHSPLGCNDDVCVVNHTTWAGSVWEFVLSSPEFTPAVQEVACELLPSMDKRKTADLFVKEKGTVMILDGNVSAQQGALLTLQFQGEGWHPVPTVALTITSTSVESSGFNTSSVQDCTGLLNFTSVLSVRVEGCSWVERLVCVSALPTPRRSIASVCTEPPEHDSAVVIVVAVTVCTIALLALLTLLFFCMRSHVGNKPQPLLFWRTRTLGRTQEETTEGNGNLGYRHESSGPVWRTDVDAPAGSSLKVPDISYITSHEPIVESGTEYLSIQRRGLTLPQELQPRAC